MVSEISAVAKNWWLFVVLGVICLGAGIVTIFWPDITLLTLGVLAGTYLMIAAVLEIIDAIVGEPGGRAISAILGVITLIAGIVCFRRPGESLLAIVIAVGIFLVAEGVLRIVRVRLRGRSLDRRRSVVIGFQLRSLRDLDTAPVAQHTAMA